MSVQVIQIGGHQLQLIAKLQHRKSMAYHLQCEAVNAKTAEHNSGTDIVRQLK